MSEQLTQNDAERRKVNADTWHAAGFTGAGVTVVCIDKRSTPHGHMADYAESPLLDDGTVGHGTNVAQCVHAFAPDARVILVQSNESGRQWIRDHAADIDVINISMSAGRPLAEHSYGFLEATGIPVVCAAGNDDKSRVSYPSRFPWTISVGAYEYSEDYETIANYSNGGDRLDCVAPTDIYVKNSGGRAFRFNGTSAAAPAASGLLACYVQWRRKYGLSRLTAEGARQFIRENSEPIEGYEYGSGLFCLPAEIPKAPEKDGGENNPKEDEDMPGKEPKEFTDIDEEFWAYDAIQECAEAGLIGGYDDGTFRPGETLTRAQFCAIMAKYMAKD
ncbi:S8 family peptidase [Salibacterium aidingense]|uniref:S8 family peptidase n=1 Tax=Salibacterium aidingense TaxID=384933 RepID=UPI003BD335BA